MNEPKIKVNVPDPSTLFEFEDDPSKFTFEQKRNAVRSAMVQLANSQPPLADAWLKVAERIETLRDELEVARFVDHVMRELRRGIEAAAAFGSERPA